MEPKYKDIEVQLSGEDGNAFFIIGRVTKALKAAKVEKPEVDAFVKDAMSGNYDHVIQTCMKWVSVA